MNYKDPDLLPLYISNNSFSITHTKRRIYRSNSFLNQLTIFNNSPDYINTNSSCQQQLQTSCSLPTAPARPSAWVPSKCTFSKTAPNTYNRLGATFLTIPAHTSGPPQHWHRMHDETFLVTKGTVRFTTGKKDVDAKVGDYIVVPPRAVHTFSNPFDEDAEFFNTFSPAYYVDYLCLTAKAIAAKGGPLSEKESKDIMAQFATFPPEGPEEDVVE